MRSTELETQIAEIDGRSAALVAERDAAAGELATVEATLGAAVADGQPIAPLEKKIGDLKAIVNRTAAALATLATRRKGAAADLAAAQLAEATATLASLETEAAAQLRAALAAGEAWLLEFNRLTDITLKSESLSSRWGNALPSAYFASAGGRPVWLGEFNRWVTDGRRFLENGDPNPDRFG